MSYMDKLDYIVICIVIVGKNNTKNVFSLFFIVLEYSVIT